MIRYFLLVFLKKKWGKLLLTVLPYLIFGFCFWLSEQWRNHGIYPIHTFKGIPENYGYKLADDDYWVAIYNNWINVLFIVGFATMKFLKRNYFWALLATLLAYRLSEACFYYLDARIFSEHIVYTITIVVDVFFGLLNICFLIKSDWKIP